MGKEACQFGGSEQLVRGGKTQRKVKPLLDDALIRNIDRHCTISPARAQGQAAWATGHRIPPAFPVG